MPAPLSQRSSVPAFLNGGGRMGQAIRAHDWSKTPLGPVGQWPSPLRTAVALMLGASQPVYIAFGAELTSLYNDAYLPIVGTKHPGGLGAPFAVLWAEIWEDFRPIVEATMAGEAQHFVNLPIALGGRPGVPVGYFTFSYTALRNDDGQAVGFYCAATETTQQVLDSARLTLSEERLELALSAGHGVGTYDWDIPNDRVVADARFAKLYGVDPVRAAAGAPIAEFFAHIHPDDFPETKAKIDEAMRTGGLLSVEYRLLQDDGSAPWVLAEGRCQLSETGEPLRFSGVTFDITARRVAEDDLRRLNADLENQVIARSSERGTTWQVSPFMLSVVDLATGRFVRVNPAWTTVLRYEPEEIVGQQYLDFLHPDDVERTMAGYSQVAAGSPNLDFENRYRAKGGEYRWLSWVAVLENGQLYSTVRDITAEKASANERERIFAASRDLIGVATFDGHLKAINPAWSAAHGRDDDALLAGSFAEIIHPEDLALTADVVATLQSGQPVDQFHVRLLKADGDAIPYAWSAVPDADPDSGLFYTVGRDISADLAKAEELRAAQDALRQSQKMEAVGQLTGGIAHDFNNLLAGIAGSLELIQKRMNDQAVTGFERHLGIAQASTERAAALTQRLLAFSRRQTLDPKPVDVNRLVRGMEDLLRRSVDPSIEIAVVGAIGLWLTKIDGGQLENAILNLVINARDAMPDGGKVTIETANKWIDGHAAKERDLAAGQYISLCVTDTGTGMPPDVIERAFDPFYTTKPLGQGTGLGLSMIHGFVRQSGGQVRVYSEVGHGTTMCLYLPRFAGELDADADTPADDQLEPGQGETVLVIDDEEPIRMLISDVLEEAGYRVLEAGDGVAGLKILQSDTRIDLLITDVGLPGGFNGRQVADAARQTRPDLKVLFVTGYADNAAIGNGHLDPGMQVITKPLPMTSLALRVREIIET